MTRARLIVGYIGEHGCSWKMGQTGSYSGVRDGKVSFTFDGHLVEKIRDRILWETVGEGCNVVPWQGEIPIELLETIE